MRTRLSLHEFPAAGRFLQTYADPVQWQSGTLAHWFHYNPHDTHCFARRIEELNNRPDPISRGELVQHLRQTHAAAGAGQRALEAVELLAQPNTFTVVGGQQAGLFGGPLFSQLKAVSAILLTRKLKLQFPNSNFVPVFWVASGDSDFEEVRRSHVLNRSGEVSTVELPPNGTHWEGEIIAARDVNEYLPAAVAELEEALPVGEQRETVSEAVRASYMDGYLQHCFIRWMAKLFADTELVFVEPDAWVRANGPRELIAQELETPSAFSSALQSRDAEIEKAGFEVQVQPLAGDTNVFYLRDGKRYKIAADPKFYLRQTGERCEDAASDAQEKPENYLPGALLNPIYQDALLRPVAFIGGASELAYRAQSSALAELHGIKLAPAFLRVTATLLPQKSAESVDELGWDLTDLYREHDEVIRSAVSQDKPEEITAALEEYLSTLHTADEKLRAAAIALDPALEETFETLRGNLIRHLEKLDKKITASLKQRSEARVRRVSLVHNQVYPRGLVQERELSLLSFLPRYGFELVQLLIDRLEFPCWEHQITLL